MGLPARRIHRQISALSSLYRLTDALAVAGGLWLAAWIAGRPLAGFSLHDGGIVARLLLRFPGLVLRPADSQ